MVNLEMVVLQVKGKREEKMRAERQQNDGYCGTVLHHDYYLTYGFPIVSNSAPHEHFGWIGFSI